MKKHEVLIIAGAFLCVNLCNAEIEKSSYKPLDEIKRSWEDFKSKASSAAEAVKKKASTAAKSVTKSVKKVQDAIKKTSSKVSPETDLSKQNLPQKQAASTSFIYKIPVISKFVNKYIKPNPDVVEMLDGIRKSAADWKAENGILSGATALKNLDFQLNLYKKNPAYKKECSKLRAERYILSAKMLEDIDTYSDDKLKKLEQAEALSILKVLKYENDIKLYESDQKEAERHKPGMIGQQSSEPDVGAIILKSAGFAVSTPDLDHFQIKPIGRNAETKGSLAEKRATVIEAILADLNNQLKEKKLIDESLLQEIKSLLPEPGMFDAHGSSDRAYNLIDEFNKISKDNDAAKKQKEGPEAAKKATKKLEAAKMKLEMFMQKLGFVKSSTVEGRFDNKAPKHAAHVVQEILGIKEEDFRKAIAKDPAVLKKYLVVRTADDGTVTGYALKNPKTGAEVEVGSYKEPTKEDLDHAADDKLDKIIEQQGEGCLTRGGSFSILIAENSEAAAAINIGAMQADPSYRGATIITASNFHGLETVHKDDVYGSIEENGNMQSVKFSDGLGKPVSGYYRDLTQGPGVALSTPAATIFRTYFKGCVDNPDDPSKWPQRPDGKNQDTNLLRDFDIKTQNGYVISDINSLKSLYQQSAFAKFRLAVQDGVEVTGGAVNGGKHTEFRDPNQKVRQVFVAALDVGPGSTFKPKSEEERQILKQAAISVLKMSYSAAIKAAFVQGSKKVVMPLVGGGAFGNDPAWIKEAIEQAMEENKAYIHAGDIHVELNAFRDQKPDPENGKAGTDYVSSYKGLVQSFGGEVRRFGTDTTGQVVTKVEKIEAALTEPITST